MNVLIVRGARAVVIAVAVAWLAYIWRIRAASFAGSETGALVVSGLLNGIIVLLVADLLWQLSKALIAYRIDLAPTQGASADELARSGRLRTLLPIFRNTLAALIAAVTILTILAGLGVQIAPLIAGAGIFGVAIGFGSQTLVKDVLSGVFYMLDDAFRVGEYIQSGSYKGTVELFSLRSVTAAASSRSRLHGSVRRARRGAEHEPRLGDRQDDDQRHLSIPTSSWRASSSRRSARSWRPIRISRPIPRSR